MPPKSIRDAARETGKESSKECRRQKIGPNVSKQATSQLSQLEDTRRSLRRKKVSLRVFSTKLWADGLVDGHKKRITEYQTVRKNYDALEADMHKLGRRWDQLLASIRMPFKMSPSHETVANDYEMGDIRNEFSQGTTYSDYQFHPVDITEDGTNPLEPTDDPLADM